MLRNLFIVFGTIAALASTSASQAHDYKLGDLTIEHPWARASIGQVPNGAAYLTIVNAGQETDRLLAVESDVAKHVALHTHLMEDGVMKMRPVDAIEVAPGAPTVLQPGGLHVMLMGLTAPLVEGELFPLTLTFERAGKVEIEVIVQEAAPMDGGTMDGGTMDGGHKGGSGDS